MREYTKALDAVQEAQEHDTEHQHAKEIAQQEAKIQQALWSQRGEETTEETLQRAMRDPEVAVSLFSLFLSNPPVLILTILGHHERSCHAADPATSAVGS